MFELYTITTLYNYSHVAEDNVDITGTIVY